ncbi:hypothetical protein EVAR_63763_1 [Eumeta japonica]|uniref:Uncharacterized protein n=1 Tax=Eumeta variegata TaxID=151549 RepID=A0A4C1ZN78_EUMVA|nr:hypothetical protein EVAR_63763_1 [Eumeta japonica]
MGIQHCNYPTVSEPRHDVPAKPGGAYDLQQAQCVSCIRAQIKEQNEHASHQKAGGYRYRSSYPLTLATSEEVPSALSAS